MPASPLPFASLLSGGGSAAPTSLGSPELPPQVPPAASGGSARGARAKLPVLLPLAGFEALAFRAAEPGTCEHKSPV